MNGEEERHLLERLRHEPMLHELCAGVFLQGPMILEGGETIVPLAPIGFQAESEYAALYVTHLLNGQMHRALFARLQESTEDAHPVVAIAIPLDSEDSPEHLDESMQPRLAAVRSALAWATGNDIAPFARIVAINAVHHIRLIPPDIARRRRLGFGNTGQDFDAMTSRIVKAARVDEHFSFALSLYHQGVRERRHLFRIAHFFCCLESLAYRLKRNAVGSRWAVKALIGLDNGPADMNFSVDGVNDSCDPIDLSGRIRDKLYHGVQIREEDISPARLNAFRAIMVKPEMLADTMQSYCEVEIARWSNGVSRGLHAPPAQEELPEQEPPGQPS